MKRHILLTKFVILASVLSMAAPIANGQTVTQMGPGQLNFEGTLYDSADQPLNQANTQLKFEVMDKNGTCVLYSEMHVVDLFTSQGAFNVKIGSGTNRLNKMTGSNSLDPKIFSNVGSVPAFPDCSNGVTLNPGEGRALRVSYNIGNGFVTLTPDYQLSTSPFAMVADTLQGRTPEDFIRIRSDANSALTQQNVERLFAPSNLEKVIAVASGSSSQYLPISPSAPINFNGQPLRNLASPGTSPSDAATKGYADSSIAGRPIDFAGLMDTANVGRSLQWDILQNKWVIAPSNLFKGSVGIGTGTPLAALDIMGSGSTSALIVPRDSTNNRPLGVNGMIRYNTTTSKLEAYGNGSWYDLAPQSSGTSSFAGVFYLPSLTTPPGTTAMALYNNNGTLMWNGQALTGTANSGWVSTGSTTYLLNGNLGVGTVIPKSQLANTNFSITDSNNIGSDLNSITWNGSGTGYTQAIYSSTGRGLLIKTLMDTPALSVDNGSIPSTPGTPLFRVLGNGRVGIGTATPMAGLDIAATGSTSAVIVPRDSTANRPMVGINGMIRYNTSTSKLEAFGNGAWYDLAPQSTGTSNFNGSMYLPVLTTAPSTSAMSLYNLNGTLMWNGSPLTNSGSTSSSNIMAGATGALPIYTSSTQVSPSNIVFVNNSLGVNALTPMASLHLNNSAPISDPSFMTGAYGTTILMGASSTSGLSMGSVSSSMGNESFISSPSSPLVFKTSMSPRMILDTMGRVGIGTTTPTATLNVAGSIKLGVDGTNEAMTITTANSAAGYNQSSPDLNIQTGSKTGGALPGAIIFSNSSPGSDGTFTYFPQERMRITHVGLGIGTKAPTYSLSFGGNTSQTIWLERNTTANTAGNDLTIQAGGASTGATNKAGGNLNLNSGIGTGNAGSSIFFQTAGISSSGTADNTTSVRMTINSSGNVGIGTQSPDQLLHIQVKPTTTNTYPILVTGSANSTIFDVRDSAGSGAVEIRKTPGEVGVLLSANGNSHLSGGNVGIGTTTPSAKLDVAGPTRLGSNGSTFQSMGACSTPAQPYAASSTSYMVDCPGVPAVTNLAVSCSLGGGSTVSTGMPILISARAIGTAGTLSVSINTNVSVSVPLHCMWVMPM